MAVTFQGIMDYMPPGSQNLADEEIPLNSPPLVLQAPMAQVKEERPKCTRIEQVGAAVAVFGMVSSAALEAWVFSQDKINPQIDALAKVVGGISAAALARMALPMGAKDAIFNFVKRYSVVLTQIGIETYYIIDDRKKEMSHTEKEIARQLLITLVIFLAGALSFDDLVQSLTMKESTLRENPMLDEPLPMKEGASRSTKRTLINETVVLTAGIFLAVLGKVVANPIIANNLGNIGVLLSSGAVGTLIAQQLWVLRDHLKENHPNSLAKPLIEHVTKFIQVTYPQVLSISMISNKWWGYSLSGAILGMARQFVRTNFQYRISLPDSAQESTPSGGRLHRLWTRVKGLWQTRKFDIFANGAIFSLATIWTAWGESVATYARARIAAGAFLATLMASFGTTAAIDLLWKPSHNAWINSGFFNAVVFPLYGYCYAYLQTQIIASDTVIDTGTLFGYAWALVAWALFAWAIGHDRWMQTSERRTEPAFTSFLARLVLIWTTTMYFMGYKLK